MTWKRPEALRLDDWMILLAVGLVSIVAGVRAGFGVPSGMLILPPVAAAAFFMSGRLTAKGELPAVASLLALLAWILVSSPLTACASYILPSLALPLIDGELARVDALLGFDDTAIVRATGEHALLAKASLFAYATTGYVLVLGLAVLLYEGNTARISRIVSLLTIGMTATLLLATLFPALGAFQHLGIAESDLGALAGTGVGTWHVPHLLALRDGSLRTFPVSDWQGLVTFPSFHTIYALVGAYALAGHRWLKWPAQIFAGFVLFTTIPIGGHYVADVLGGAAIYAATLAWLERPLRAAAPRVCTPASPDLAPA